MAVPPSPPAGYAWIGDAYHVTTTAGVRGSVQIALHYDPAAVPGGKEGRLALLHLVGSRWLDVTTEVDPKADTVSGAVPVPRGSGLTDLSIFAVAFKEPKAR